MFGTIAGQVVSLLLSLLVTRLYTPEMFASLEHFSMILGIMSVFVGGRYEPAIMLPKKEVDAKHLLAHIIRISGFSMFVLMVLSFLFGKQLSNALGNPDLYKYLWLIGPTSFLFVFTTAVGFWFSRLKKYKPAASSKAVFSLTSEPAKVIYGYFKSGPGGLVYSVGLGHLATSIFLFLRLKKLTPGVFKGITREGMKAVAKDYKDYPKYAIPSSLLSRLAQWLHIALFGMLFGSAGLIAVGFLGLCRRIVMTPLNTFGASFSQVFYQRLTEIDNEKLKAYYVRMLKLFLLIGLGMIAVVWALPENTMTLIFGDDWGSVLKYLRVLVFWFSANFAVGSLSFILHRLRSQKTILILDALHFSLVLVALLGTYFLGGDEFDALIAFVVMKVVYLSINVLITLRKLSNPEV